MIYEISLLLSILDVLLATSDTNVCGESSLQQGQGLIRIRPDLQTRTVYCNWTISVEPGFQSAILLLHCEFSMCIEEHGNRLDVTNDEEPTKHLCSSRISKPKGITLLGREISVSLQTSCRRVELWLEYHQRPNAECSRHEFQCLDKSNCFNAEDICSEKSVCHDLSNNRGCHGCRDDLTPCDFYSSACFNRTQRCNSFLDCAEGDDEFGCSKECPGGIKCSEEQICLNKNQICDRVFDCANGYDEKHCYDNVPPKAVVVSVLFVLCSLCCTIFICIVLRLLVNRRDRILRENLPEFPLAPFQGPGDQEVESSASEVMMVGDVDFRQGGEVFENYMLCVKKRSISKSVQVGSGLYSHLEIDGENELVVLASLNVPLSSCVGLSITDEDVNELASRNSILTIKPESEPSSDRRLKVTSAPTISKEETSRPFKQTRSAIAGVRRKQPSPKVTRPSGTKTSLKRFHSAISSRCSPTPRSRSRKKPKHSKSTYRLDPKMRSDFRMVDFSQRDQGDTSGSDEATYTVEETSVLNRCLNNLGVGENVLFETLEASRFGCVSSNTWTTCSSRETYRIGEVGSNIEPDVEVLDQWTDIDEEVRVKLKKNVKGKDKRKICFKTRRN